MIDLHSDLWPDDISEVGNLVTPVAILKEQAAILGAKTKNIVKGSVVLFDDRSSRYPYHYGFYLVAPVLSDYRYLLFSAGHGPGFYPLFIDSFGEDDRFEVADQNEFLEKLKYIFSSNEARNVIRAMLAQVRDISSTPFVQQKQNPSVTTGEIPF